MKAKRIIITSVVCAVMLVVSAVSYAASEAGRVLAVKSDVYRIRAEARDSAKPQMGLLIKDAVETAENSRTKLYFTDDSILNLGELSKVEVEEYLYSPEKQRSKAIYRLMEGAVKVVVGRSDLEVHTASAVAAARGTKFIMWSKDVENKREKTRSRQSCVMTLEGKVEFKLKKEAITDKTKKDRVLVNEGTVSCIEADNVSDIQPISSEMKSEWSKEFVVLYAGDLKMDEKPAAFAPPTGEPFVLPPDPILPVQEPAVEPNILKMGDFERIDSN